MIEVEKKFQPTDEQYKILLEGAEFLEEVILKDNLYDFPDYRLAKKDIRLRNRNGHFELKIGQSEDSAEEIESEDDIKKYFNVSNLEEFVKNSLVILTDYSTKRRRYKKGEFTIDIDELSFGYNVCEIEILVEKTEDVNPAEDKILGLAREIGIEIKDLPSKRAEYLRIAKPEVYKLIYNK